jgi:diguanylate cyclase (GGDEF)-like protein
MTDDEIEFAILQKYVAQYRVAEIRDSGSGNKCDRELSMREVIKEVTKSNEKELEYLTELWFVRLVSRKSTLDNSRAPLLSCGDTKLNNNAHRYNARAFLNPSNSSAPAWNRISELEAKVIERKSFTQTKQITDSEGSERKKSEKFLILDSPSLRKNDMKLPAGPRGRALLYLDIDHFKLLNTKYKETRVDQTLLPAFHTLLRDIAEPHGYIYAEGGDEIVILLNNSSSYLACAIAEDIRITLENTKFHVGEDSVHFTISIGVAHSDDHDTGTDLQMKANEAKDISKQEGRNRTSIARRDKIEFIRLERPIFEPPSHPIVSAARLKEMVEEEEAIITEYVSRSNPFYSYFYCAGRWKPNRFMTMLPGELREQVVSRISASAASNIPRVRRSIILIKALDARGQPCLLHYFSGRPTDGWRTWLLPSVDRDAVHSREDLLKTLADDLHIFLGLSSEKVSVHELPALSVCVKTNRYAPEAELRMEPKFYAFRYYYATVSNLPEHLLKRSSTIPQGSIERRLRWFYSEELPSADDQRIIEANADVIRTISDVCTTLLINIPEASPGCRLLD